MDGRNRYKAGYIRFVSSYDGMAIFEVSMYRKTRSGTHDNLNIEVEMSRSSLSCVHKAMKDFADKEREQVGRMPL